MEHGLISGRRFWTFSLITFVCVLCYFLPSKHFYLSKDKLGMENQTTVTEFIILGVLDDYQLQYMLFTILVVTYILTLTSNILIITITLMNHHLQTPMYFFLRNISILDICFTTTAVPKALANVALGKNQFL